MADDRLIQYSLAVCNATLLYLAVALRLGSVLGMFP